MVQSPPPGASPRSRRAFTLVELLVVIGIIALLISILLPVLNKAREQAKAIACASNEKQLLLAFNMYVSDHKGATPIFPPVEGTWPTSNDPFHKSFAYYMDSLGVLRYDHGSFWRYVTSGLHYVQQTGNTQGPPPETLYRVMNCPSDIDTRGVERNGSLNITAPRNFSYSWNGSFYCDSPPPLGTASPVLWKGSKSTDQHAVSKLNQIVHPAQKIILEEESHPNDGWSFVGFPGDNADDTPGFRHNGRANWGFADGHVESLGPSDIGYSTVYHFNDIAQPINRDTCARFFHLQSDAQ